jgi:excisionase family DNA binding protein
MTQFIRESVPQHLQLHTVDDVAAILGVSTKSVYEWIKADALPAKRLGPGGRLIRVSQADLETFIDTDFQEEQR